MDPVALRPLGVGEILDVAVKIYRANFKKLVYAAGVVVAPVSILGAIVQISIAPSRTGSTFITPASEPGAAPTFDANQFWKVMAGNGVVILLILIATQLALATSFKAVSEAYIGHDYGWKDSVAFAFGKVWSLLWVTFLVLVLTGLGYLLCLVPGIYLYGAWIVAVPVLLIEDRRGLRALQRSRDLVSGRWWPVFGAVFVGSILASILRLIFTIPVVALDVASANDVVRMIVNGVAQAASLSLATPFTAAVIATVYFDLRVRKEGYDLQLLASSIGVDPATVEAAPFYPMPPRPPGAMWPPAPGQQPQPAIWPPPAGQQPPPMWPPPPGQQPPSMWPPPPGQQPPPMWPPPPGQQPPPGRPGAAWPHDETWGPPANPPASPPDDQAGA